MQKITLTSLTILFCSAALNFGCSKSSDSDTSSDEEQSDSLQATLSDNFPSFYELASETAPALTSSSQLELPLALASFSTTYTTDSTSFLNAFSVDQNYIGQVLNDAGINGPVKSIYVLLAQVQSDLDEINEITVHEEDAGEFESDQRTCTKLSDSEVTTPFFSEAANEAFNAWEDEGKYTCLYDRDDEEEGTGVFAFGSVAISDPPSDCDEADAYEFFVIQGSAQDDDENTEQVSTRGSTVDRSSIKKFYYNGCTGSLNIAYAQTTLYSLGVEFTSRTELSGNSKDKTFTLRSNFIDVDSTYATHNTFVGHGKSRKASDSDDDAYFIMGYRSDDCGNSSNSESCTLGTEKTFCVQNTGTGTDLTLAADTSECSDYTDSYTDLDVLLRSDLPTEYFEVSENVAGF